MYGGALLEAKRYRELNLTTNELRSERKKHVAKYIKWSEELFCVIKKYKKERNRFCDLLYRWDLYVV